MGSEYDQPKSLGSATEQQRRAALIRRPHVMTLTDFVGQLRHECQLDREIPYFDPLDGGVNAQVLFILEAPGPKAVTSGFVSRNNPDESAKNFFLSCRSAGLPREETVTWNIVPWYIGEGTKIRPASGADIKRGMPYLARLLDLLPRLECVVLVGRKAQRIEGWLQAMRPDLTIFRCPHPSPVFVNRKPENRTKLENSLRAVTETLQRRAVSPSGGKNETV